MVASRQWEIRDCGREELVTDERMVKPDERPEPVRRPRVAEPVAGGFVRIAQPRAQQGAERRLPACAIEVADEGEGALVPPGIATEHAEVVGPVPGRTAARQRRKRVHGDDPHALAVRQRDIDHRKLVAGDVADVGDRQLRQDRGAPHPTERFDNTVRVPRVQAGAGHCRVPLRRHLDEHDHVGIGGQEVLHRRAHGRVLPVDVGLGHPDRRAATEPVGLVVGTAGRCDREPVHQREHDGGPDEQPTATEDGTGQHQVDRQEQQRHDGLKRLQQRRRGSAHLSRCRNHQQQRDEGPCDDVPRATEQGQHLLTPVPIGRGYAPSTPRELHGGRVCPPCHTAAGIPGRGNIRGTWTFLLWR